MLHPLPAAQTLESLQLSQCRWLLSVELDCPMLTQVGGTCNWAVGGLAATTSALPQSMLSPQPFAPGWERCPAAPRRNPGHIVLQACKTEKVSKRKPGREFPLVSGIT